MRDQVSDFSQSNDAQRRAEGLCGAAAMFLNWLGEPLRAAVADQEKRRKVDRISQMAA